MSNDLKPEQVAYDFLAREYLELAKAFGTAQPALSAKKLSETEERLNKQFDALVSLFKMSGLEQELTQVIGPSRTLLATVLEQAKAQHPHGS